MAYKKGMAHIDRDWQNYDDKNAIMLPHSCDDWVIGTPKQAKVLVDDLNKLIKEFKDFKNE